MQLNQIPRIFLSLLSFLINQEKECIIKSKKRHQRSREIPTREDPRIDPGRRLTWQGERGGRRTDWQRKLLRSVRERERIIIRVLIFDSLRELCGEQKESVFLLLSKGKHFPVGESWPESWFHWLIFLWQTNIGKRGKWFPGNWIPGNKRGLKVVWPSKVNFQLKLYVWDCSAY